MRTPTPKSPTCRAGRGLALGLGLLCALTACSSGGGHAQSTTSSAPGSPTPSILGTTTATTSTPGKAAGTLTVRAAPWSLPAPLDREAAVTDHGQVVVLGGNRDGGISAIVDTIDPATGAARRLALLAQPVHDAAGGTIGDRPAVFGGGAGTARDEVQVVQPNGSTAVVGRLPQPRADVASASSRGTVYIVGGYDGTTKPADVLATVDGVNTHVVARLVVPVRYPAVAITGDRLFVIGGATSGGENAGVDTNVIQQVDLHTGQTTIRGRMRATRSHAAAVVLGGRVYVLGGHVDGNWSNDVAAFDPATGELRVVAHLPRAVSDAAATVVGSTAYLLGGETAPNTPIADVVELRVR